MEVKGADGKVQVWKAETEFNQPFSSGAAGKRDSLKAGDAITSRAGRRGMARTTLRMRAARRADGTAIGIALIPESAGEQK